MTLEELKKEIRPLDETSMEQAREHWIKIAKPLFSLGKLEDAVIQMAGIKETPDYELKKKALVIMCADNGIVEEGVTQTGQEVTAVLTTSRSNSPLGIIQVIIATKIISIKINVYACGIRSFFFFSILSHPFLLQFHTYYSKFDIQFPHP